MSSIVQYNAGWYSVCCALCAVRCMRALCAVEASIMLRNAVEWGGLYVRCSCSPTVCSLELFLPSGMVVRSKSDTKHNFGILFCPQLSLAPP